MLQPTAFRIKAEVVSCGFCIRYRVILCLFNFHQFFTFLSVKHDGAINIHILCTAKVVIVA
jgi:hypothetical protein